MTVRLVLDPARLWRWHLALIDQLEAAGVSVAVSWASAPRPLSQALSLALRLEQTLAGRQTETPFSRLSKDSFASWTRGDAARSDLMIDLTRTCLPGDHGYARQIVPLYYGKPGEDWFWSALLDGRAPELSLFDDTSGDAFDIGQPAIESPHALGLSAAAVVTRLITGLVRAASGAAFGVANSGWQDFAPGRLERPAAHLLGRKVASKARRLLERTVTTAPQWSVAWRRMDSATDVPSSATITPGDYTLLPDDGARYYADPFLFAHEGALHLFVEEFPYATGRGIISAATLGADGTFGTPKPIIEEPHHLSYPHVFARDGAIWMLPEASASGGLTLYRAERFPNTWEPAARLIDEPVHDATLFEFGGRLWIAAATQGPEGARWGSSWDSLSLYSAERLLGPWMPHPGNPVLIDAASARPGGEVFLSGGALVRPVQDCRTGYGTALGLARIDRLDGDGFSQTVIGRMDVPKASGLTGLHTLNRVSHGGATYEAIDVFGTAARIGRSFRQPRRTL
jgi:hypothetical protein